MKNNSKDINNKILLYIILLLVLIACAIIAFVLIHKTYSERNIYEDKNQEVVNELKKYLSNINEDNNIENITDKNVNEFDLEFEGFKVIGIIKIPKIELEYPILEKTSDRTMKISISRFWGGEINEYGNLSLAGHNNYDGTMFGKNKKLQIGDIVELTDLKGETIKYEIKEIFKTDPNDTSVLVTEDESVRELTLITCSNGRAERLIIKAFEINYLEER